MTHTLLTKINSFLKYKDKIFTFLVIGIVLSVFSYIYLLHSAISNVVARNEIVQQSRAMSTDVSELESKYFIVKNTINIELAHEKGFKDSEITSFISNKSLTAMVHTNEL